MLFVMFLFVVLSLAARRNNMHFIYRHIGKTPAQMKERDERMERMIANYQNMLNNLKVLEDQVEAIKAKAKNKSEK